MKLKVFANFRDICGAKTVQLEVSDKATVEEMLDVLIETFPPMREEVFTETKQLKPMVHVFVNGKNVMFLEGLQTKVHTDDEIALFPPVAGG